MSKRLRELKEDWAIPVLQGLIQGLPCYGMAYVAFLHLSLVPHEVHHAYWQGTVVLTEAQATSITLGHTYLLGSVIIAFLVKRVSKD